MGLANLQKHTPSEQVRGQAGDIKSMVMNITMNLIINSRNVIAQDDYRPLLSWGAEIEMFDSFISIYYLGDTKYISERDNYKKEISFLLSERNSLTGRIKIFKKYTKWFSLICTKLARFKIFPPLPVSYAQNLGELREAE